MRETMIFGQSYSFDELLAVLGELEAKLNANAVGTHSTKSVFLTEPRTVRKLNGGHGKH